MNYLLRLDPQGSVLVHIAKFQACFPAAYVVRLVLLLGLAWVVSPCLSAIAQDPAVPNSDAAVDVRSLPIEVLEANSGLSDETTIATDQDGKSVKQIGSGGEIAADDPSDGSSERAVKVKFSVKRDLVYRRIADEKLAVDVYWPTNSTKSPVVVMLYGGAWVAGDKWNLVDHARELAQAGFVAMNFNYRLAPKHKYPAQIDDARAALQWSIEHASEFNGDAERVAVWGYSAGAQLSAILSCERSGKQSQPIAAVLGGPPCEFSFLPDDSEVLKSVFGGTRQEVPEIYTQASPVELVNEYTCPTFIFHGSQDRIVPPSSSQAYAEKLRQLRLEVGYFPVEEQGHLLAFLNLEARRRAITFLNEQLSVKQ